VAGGAGLTGSVSVQPGLMAGETAYPSKSGSCLYDAGRHVALVPVQVEGRGEGAMTFHVTATVAQQASGDQLVQTAVTDIPYPASAHGHLGTWVQIPLDQAAWQAGATECRVRWTMTPGAWFPNDD
jgi:hypothetical protein